MTLASWVDVTNTADGIKSARRTADGYLVEVHKKYAITLACLVFVLVGIPLALRFPRGGMGLVLGGGLGIFALYYISLTAGEPLADAGHPPAGAGHVGAERRVHDPRALRAPPGQPRTRLDPRRRPRRTDRHGPPARGGMEEARMTLTILDRYVLRSWIRIFLLTALGFPVVSILIKITDEIRKLLGRGLDLSPRSSTATCTSSPKKSPW